MDAETVQGAKCGLFILPRGRDGRDCGPLLPQRLWLMNLESSQETGMITIENLVIASEGQIGIPLNCTACSCVCPRIVTQSQQRVCSEDEYAINQVGRLICADPRTIFSCLCHTVS